MTQINAYLTFGGNCREAMTFYKECLGGDLTMQAVGETPAASEMPPEAKDSIMHATLQKDSLVLMASDKMSPMELKQGNTITLSLNCSSEEEIKTFFSNLSSDGQVTMPLADQFWGATFGMLTDKFGMNWMLNYHKNPKQ